ncbi:MAG: LPS export ABC transporter periplasmic protein LptC [Candidatus Cloacimonadota bacterium]|nr:LPS export ABC transporter periplasmic protein LptC [Candidatus Cloacimonadota bacterium]
MKISYTVIFAFLIFSNACQQNEVGTQNENFIESTEIADSIIVYQSSKGKNEWILAANKMKKFTENNDLFFYHLKLEILGNNGEINSTIFADSAKINNNEDLIRANGNVKIYTIEGNLFGNSLIWDKKTGKIFSQDSVRVVKDGNTIWGDRFESDDKFKHVVVHQATAEGEISDSTKVW